MKLISGWIGVILVAISLTIQLLHLINQQKNGKITILAQIIIVLANIFWIIYAFMQPQIYWPTGISNIVIAIFSLIFIMINLHNLKQTKSLPNSDLIL